MLSFFKEIAVVHNLSLTGQEILRAVVIGLDGPNRKLVIVEENNETYDPKVIDLLEVDTCRVKKVYMATHSGDPGRKRPEDHLRSIALEFDFKTRKEPVAVFFYRNGHDSIHEIAELQSRVKNWESVISKILVA